MKFMGGCVEVSVFLSPALYHIYVDWASNDIWALSKTNKLKSQLVYLFEQQILLIKFILICNELNKISFFNMVFYLLDFNGIIY